MIFLSLSTIWKLQREIIYMSKKGREKTVVDEKLDKVPFRR